MRLVIINGLAAALLLTPSVAGITCFTDGQPFNEGWTYQRLENGCKALTKDRFRARQNKFHCAPMGDDHVQMQIHNNDSGPHRMTWRECKQKMYNIINDCDNHEGHGGLLKTSLWNVQ